MTAWSLENNYFIMRTNSISDCNTSMIINLYHSDKILLLLNSLYMQLFSYF